MVVALDLAALSWPHSLPGADHVGEKTVGPGHARRQLPKEGKRGEDVDTPSIARIERAAELRLLARIVRLEHRLIVRIPLARDVNRALLHPAIEIALGN